MIKFDRFNYVAILTAPRGSEIEYTGVMIEDVMNSQSLTISKMFMTVELDFQRFNNFTMYPN